MTCYNNSQCFHIATCCEGSNTEICLCDPIDVINYPNDATIYFAARFHNFYRPNIHVVFEDRWGTVTEDTYNMKSDWTWGYSSYEMDGWNGKITAELRDGSNVKETIVTYSNGPVGKVLDFKKVGGITEVGETVKIMCDLTNIGGCDGDFKIQLVNSDTGEELGVGGGVGNPGCQMGTTFNVKLPSTPQKLNLRYNVIILVDEKERIDDYATMTLNVAKSSAWARIDVDAPEYANQGDEVVMKITVTNTGGVAVDMGVELYDGSTRIGACAGTSNIKPGEWMMSQYTKTMPDHDWNLMAKVVSDPSVNVTKDFTIMVPCVSGNTSNKTCSDGTSIILKQCIDGVWKDTGNRCPDEHVDDKTMIYIAIGVGLILLSRLLKR